MESPTKIKTLKKFLGKDFTYESSVGHIRDLPPSKFGIDVEHNFDPQYELLEDKKDIINQLKKAAKTASIVYLAPDPDREGEAIAWHILSILPKSTKCKRITFHEFTKGSIQRSIKEPRDINQKLVDAQQARRLLDRIVGYKLSPILQRKIPRDRKTQSLSAGRVQSVALKLVVDREREIEAFVPIEYWNLGAKLTPQKEKKDFLANLLLIDGNKIEKEKSGKAKTTTISDEKTAKSLDAKLKKSTYTVSSVTKKEKKRNPSPPFITSSLQQEASRHYGFSASRTMSIAQSLYEGVDIGNHGTEGLITYMRTDSVRASPEAITQARKVIRTKYGKDFLPESPFTYKTKKQAQDAHECIRPTHLSLPPEKVESHLSIDQNKLYQLIWKRFLSSQMNPAIYDTVSCDIETDTNLTLRATGSVIKFFGFLALYEEKYDHSDDQKDKDSWLPALKEGQVLKFLESFCTQSFTKPPPRFTEASLIKELEKSGIGRPSTYSSIMQKIQGRSYTLREKNTLKPTELGKIISDMLETNFPKIMDITFTKEMEDELDKIAETDVDWKSYIKHFWKDFIPTVEKAEKEAVVPKLETDKKCPKCGKTLLKIWGKSNYFYGCSGYPDCDYRAPLEELTYNKEDYAKDFDWEQKCPKCGSEMKVRKGPYGIFLGCSTYPECRGIVSIPLKDDIPQDQLPSCPAIGCDGNIVQRRSRFGKPFFSCSNYPDCNVIANSIDQLHEKYVNHPKTPYVKKARKKALPKKKTRATKKTTTKREQPTYTPSKDLAKVTGKDPISRPDATKKIWDYIKKHNLQNPENKRQILADAALQKVFSGEKKIDMMQIAKHLSKHLAKDA